MTSCRMNCRLMLMQRPKSRRGGRAIEIDLFNGFNPTWGEIIGLCQSQVVLKLCMASSNLNILQRISMFHAWATICFFPPLQGWWFILRGRYTWMNGTPAVILIRHAMFITERRELSFLLTASGYYPCDILPKYYKQLVIMAAVSSWWYWWTQWKNGCVSTASKKSNAIKKRRDGTHSAAAACQGKTKGKGKGPPLPAKARAVPIGNPASTHQ